MSNMTDATKERLQRAQAELQRRGALDVKFSYNFSMFDPPKNLSAEKLGSDVADMVEAVLEGRTRPMPPIGDSVMLINGKMSNEMTPEDWEALCQQVKDNALSKN